MSDHPAHPLQVDRGEKSRLSLGLLIITHTFWRWISGV